jgi:hypothetical protein
MLRKVLPVIVVILIMAPLCCARDIDGVDLPDSLTIGENTLLLNGAGVRTKFFLDFYVVGLYLQQKAHDPVAIINADEVMAVRLEIVSAIITGRRMAGATKDGFEKSTAGNTAAIKERIEKFIDVFNNNIGKNDTFDLLYLPGRGVEIYKNNQSHTLIEGLDFKQALFGIWLGEDPAQMSLKRQMLGQ